MEFEQAKERILDFKRVFGSPEGKKILLELMNTYHILNPVQSNDPYALARAEGQRSVVLAILHKCAIDLEAFEALVRGKAE